MRQQISHPYLPFFTSFLGWGLFFLFFTACHSRQKGSQSTPSTYEQHLKEKYGQMLGLGPSAIHNLPLYRMIDDWYGVPYKYGGQDKNGIDCSGFICLLYEAVYHRKAPRSTKELMIWGKAISKAELQEGDLVFFKLDGQKVSHVGLYLAQNKFVHASTKKGIMISDLTEPIFTQSFAQAQRP